MSVTYDHDHENEITLFAETNFRNERRRFGIKTDDRRRHMYIIGKTGMGKTTLLENLILADVYAGHGCCYIDPHGDTAEKLVDFIPSFRVNDVVYFNPADTAFPTGFNILETEAEWQKPLVASGLMGVFKKIWPDVWSARMEYILMNCVLALLDYPGATLLGITRLLADKDYRTRVVAKIRDPIVKMFWVAEFTSWSEKYATEAIAAVQNKVGQFLSSPIIRNIVAQVKSTVDLRRIMDDGKILIANLSKGRIGEDNMRLLGGMLITKLQLAAQERQNVSELERRDFYLFVDEFQNFANESFATILSEARKYRLNLIVAHQYIEQLDEKVAPAIFGNVGTIITMRVGAADAEFMEQEFTPTFTPEDLVNLPKANVYLKLMVDGVSTPPFSATTLPPIAKVTGNAEKVIAVSRERYSEPRAVIEEKVLRWSGMEAISSGADEGDLKETGTNMTSASVNFPTIITEDESRERLAVAPDLTPPPAPPAPRPSQEYLTLRPERLASISASITQAKKKNKPEYPHTCTRCGKVWTLAVKLDPARPMYCPECRPIVAAERKQKESQVKQVRRVALPSEEAPEVTEVEPSTGPNRPRIILDHSSAPRPSRPTEHRPARAPGLMSELVRQKGPVERDKRVLEARAGRPVKRNKPRPSEKPASSYPSSDLPSLSFAPPPSPDAFVPSTPPKSEEASFVHEHPEPPDAPPSQLTDTPTIDSSADEETSNGTSVQPGQRVKF